MSGLSNIPTDYKKWFDTALKKYLPKENVARTLFDIVEVDSAQVTLEYVKQTQSYTDAKGWTSFSDPTQLADGSKVRMDSIGTEDATSTPSTYASGFRLDRKLLNSGLPIQQQYVASHSQEVVKIIENYTNRLLIANMAGAAGQSFTATGGTWGTTGDPVADLLSAKMTFKKQSGGIDADFALFNNDQMVNLQSDFRFQNKLYVTGSELESGKITERPLGLNVLVDPAVTSGTFFLGKKGMFGRMLVTENLKTFEEDEGVAGKTLSAVYSFVDQYPLPYYLLYGTGV